MQKVTIFTKMLFGVIFGGGHSSQYDVQLIDVANAGQDSVMMQKIAVFESTFDYPFSNTEKFSIEHGREKGYFSFFKNLGKPYYFVVTSKRDQTVKKIVDGKEIVIRRCKGEIAAVACCILRTFKQRGKKIRAWYICDLKVVQNYQNEHLPMFILQSSGLPRFWQCPRGFGICMNPPSGEPKAARIFKKHSTFSGMQTYTLNLYALTAAQVHQYGPILSNILIKRGYLKKGESLVCVSTSGSKDYRIFNVLDNTVRDWHLLHLRPGKGVLKPSDGATHLICSVEGTSLDNEFKSVCGSPSSTAQIVSYGMKNFDFNAIWSNEI